MKWHVVCNYLGDKVFRKGAKLILIFENGGTERFFFYGMSLGGRKIRKYAPLKKCYNARVISANPKLDLSMAYDNKEMAEKIAQRMSNIISDLKIKKINP